MTANKLNNTGCLWAPLFLLFFTFIFYTTVIEWSWGDIDESPQAVFAFAALSIFGIIFAGGIGFVFVGLWSFWVPSGWRSRIASLFETSRSRAEKEWVQRMESHKRSARNKDS